MWSLYFIKRNGFAPTCVCVCVYCTYGTRDEYYKNKINSRLTERNNSETAVGRDVCKRTRLPPGRYCILAAVDTRGVRSRLTGDFTKPTYFEFIIIQINPYYIMNPSKRSDGTRTFLLLFFFYVFLCTTRSTIVCLPSVCQLESHIYTSNILYSNTYKIIARCVSPKDSELERNAYEKKKNVY